MWSSVQLVCDLSDYSCNYGIWNVPSMAICFSGAFDYVAMIQLLYFTIWSMLALTLDCQSVDCLSKRVMGSFLRTSIFSFWHVGDDIGLQRNVLADTPDLGQWWSVDASTCEIDSWKVFFPLRWHGALPLRKGSGMSCWWSVEGHSLGFLRITSMLFLLRK